MLSRSSAAVEPGHRIRALREARGLSLRDLAHRSGVSAPMLSQVERGETSPTLAVAAKIAHGLDLSLSQLVRLDEASSVTLVRPSERRSVDRDGHRIEELTPSLPGDRATMTLHTLRPGARTGAGADGPLHAPGSREIVLVQTGKLRLVIDGVAHELRAGDVVTFDADLPHHLENPSARATTFIAVVTAGLRAT